LYTYADVCMSPRIYLTTFLLSLFTIIQAKPADDIILYGIELGINQDYDKALAIFEDQQAQNPGDPAPHLYKAGIYQTMMMDFESDHWRENFNQEINSLTLLCDSLLRLNAQDNRVLYFKAAGLSYASFQLAHEKKYLTSIRTAITAINNLEKVLERDSSYCDALLAIGAYQYWRSYLTRHFAWLPFFSDQRAQGIHLLEKVYHQSTYSKWAAMSNLGWIYIQEKQFKKAVRCAENGLLKFPESRFFLWLEGEASFHDRQFERAEKTFSKLLYSVTAEKYNNHYNEIVLHYKLAECHHELGNDSDAMFHANKVLEIVPDENVKQRIRKKQYKAVELVRLINQKSLP